MVPQAQKKIRRGMPPNYGPILRDRTNTTLPYIYRVVNKEIRNAKIWPDVLQLMKEYQDSLRQQEQLERELLEESREG
jgi:hypothetical protein